MPTVLRLLFIYFIQCYVSENLFFGSGNGVEWTSLGDSLDIVAHEFMHGVIQHTAELSSGYESGVSFCF
jgi:Zn-dependent metalloprotease